MLTFKNIKIIVFIDKIERIFRKQIEPVMIESFIKIIACTFNIANPEQIYPEGRMRSPVIGFRFNGFFADSSLSIACPMAVCIVYAREETASCKSLKDWAAVSADLLSAAKLSGVSLNGLDNIF